jgi:hypothetical protein
MHFAISGFSGTAKESSATAATPRIARAYALRSSEVAGLIRKPRRLLGLVA